MFLIKNAQAILSMLVLASSTLHILRPRFRRFFRQKDSPSHNEQPLLLSYYSQGHSLQNIAKGVLGNMHYSVFITTPDTANPYGSWTPPESLIYRLELPFHTQAHIVGLSTAYRDQLPEVTSFIRSQQLEPIELEGDFPHYFSLFAGSGQQQITRYIFDPKAMAYAVDFCKNNFWEIAGDEMYFVSEQGHQAGNVLRKSIEFVEQIRPALPVDHPNAVTPHHEAPYREYRGPGMKCPICVSDLREKASWFECPKGCGHLIHGGSLTDLHHGKVEKPSSSKNVPTTRLSGVICPHCGKPMSIVDYQFAGIFIDSCTSCPYRWLDAGELAKVAPSS